MPGRVVVVGSANVDLVLGVDHLVAPGETLLAATTRRRPGGKGANQAVAAARAGATTALIGAVGNDPDGELVARSLIAAGADVAALRTVASPTGVAVVQVLPDGENAIVVAPGANHALGDLTDADRDLVERADVVLASLEVPAELMRQAAVAARSTLVLNASPVTALPPDLLDRVDVLVVNADEAAAWGEDLLARAPAVVVTRGADGGVLRRRDAPDVEFPAVAAEVVDTTGAGDAFVGALAAAMAGGADWPETLLAATRAAAATVEHAGAQAER